MHMFNTIMFMGLQALYQVSILLILNFTGSHFSLLKQGSVEYQNKLKNTLIFNAFVFCQVSGISHFRGNLKI